MGNVVLCALPLCIFNDICFERNLGEKFSGDCRLFLNGKARTNLVTINLCEGWGTFVIENITNDPAEFADLIFHGGWFEYHADIPFTSDVDDGCD
jgi:hypothetical protein